MKTEYQAPPLPLCLQWKDEWQAAADAATAGMSAEQLTAYYQQLNQAFMERQEQLRAASVAGRRAEKA